MKTLLHGTDVFDQFVDFRFGRGGVFKFLLYFFNRLVNGGVIFSFFAVSSENIADIRQGKICDFAENIHRYLPGENNVSGSFFAFDVRNRNFIMLGHGGQDFFDRYIDRFIFIGYFAAWKPVS